MWSLPHQGNQGSPSHSRLTSPTFAVGATGPVQLRFRHRYSIEPDWDGASAFVSVNGAPFTQVLAASYSLNGNNFFGLVGNHDLNGGEGFNGNSPGYDAGNFITSIATLGSLNSGDTVAIQFLGAWDEFARGSLPNWEINSVTVTDIPEPSAILLLLVGLFGMLMRRSRTC